MECIQNDKLTKNLWNFDINIKIEVAKCQFEKIATANELYNQFLTSKKIIYYLLRESISLSVCIVYEFHTMK